MANRWGKMEAETDFIFLGSKITHRWHYTPASVGDIRDTDSIPRSGRSLGEENGNPPQYSCLENPVDRKAWQPTVHRVTKSHTQLKGLSTHSTESLQTMTAAIKLKMFAPWKKSYDKPRTVY